MSPDLQADQCGADAPQIELLVGQQRGRNTLLLDGCLALNHLARRPAAHQHSLLAQLTRQLATHLKLKAQGLVMGKPRFVTCVQYRIYGIVQASRNTSHTTKFCGVYSAEAIVVSGGAVFAHLTMPKDRKVEMKDVATPNSVNSTGTGGTLPC